MNKGTVITCSFPILFAVDRMVKPSIGMIINRTGSIIESIAGYGGRVNEVNRAVKNIFENIISLTYFFNKYILLVVFGVPSIFLESPLYSLHIGVRRNTAPLYAKRNNRQAVSG